MSDISLMCVTYNRLNFTKRWYSSLLKTTTIPFNLIIIDNASTDGTVDWLKELKKEDIIDKLIIHYNTKNKGIAVGRNQGLKIADEIDTKWYCTIDNDVEMPHDNWLQECIDILTANTQYGGIGVNMEDNKYSLVTLNGYTFQNKPQGNLGTACIVFPKSVHKLVGFFNTEYGFYGEEDADLGMRCRVLGLKFGYIECMGIHFGQGKLDTGEYREWKTECHAKNLKKFQQNCAAYFRKEKSVYIPYKD